MHTYGLSGDKVATITVDIVIIIDKIARGDVPFASQTIAILGRGGRIERARGFVLSRTEMITSREGGTACWHKKLNVTRLLAFPEARTQERTIYPWIHRLYHRLIYTCLLPDRGASSALPRYGEQDVNERLGWGAAGD
jgi:hypothetical protein